MKIMCPRPPAHNPSDSSRTLEDSTPMQTVSKRSFVKDLLARLGIFTEREPEIETLRVMKMPKLSEGYEYFEVEGKFGIREAVTKEVIVPPNYAYFVDSFPETAVVRINGREMIIDKDGNFCDKE